MYSIANIVCGCKMPNLVYSYLEEVFDVGDGYGFQCLYSGYGDIVPSYSGLIVGRLTPFDDVTAEELIKQLTVNETQMEQARCEIAKTKKTLEELILSEDSELSEEEREALLNSIPDEPTVFILWSTS